jgi:hypothetical protein
MVHFLVCVVQKIVEDLYRILFVLDRGLHA